MVLGAIIAWKELSFRLVMKKSRETHSSSLKADAWAALFASGFIFYNSYLIFRPALGEIMDEHLYDHLGEEIHRVALEVPGVAGTEKCFIRKAGMKYHVDLHATVDADITVRQGHAVAHTLKDTLRREIPRLGHVLIHIEPDERA